MKYYIDTEFIEDFHKPLFGKRRHFIDLISIAIVCEDGRQYYAISNEFKTKDASDWVKKNVIAKLYDEDGFKLTPCWKSNAQIAQEIKQFVYDGCEAISVEEWGKTQDIEFYGYYSDYDWVLFCSLFGTMITLPEGFPMFCLDLKQTIHEKEKVLGEKLKFKRGYPIQVNEHSALDDARWNKNLHSFLQTI
jgi:hypothetical protein